MVADAVEETERCLAFANARLRAVKYDANRADWFSEITFSSSNIKNHQHMAGGISSSL
jgi:replicative superfamily II helicase